MIQIRKGLLVAVLAASVPVALRAQDGIGAVGADSTQYLRARSMVANGNAAAGRQLVDSLLRASRPGTAAYAEGLYWRATLAASATSAERDYRQIVVDYPLSPRVAESLLRLGQLEAARGDRAAAMQHFQRINLEHPESPLRAEASYWIARMDLEKNDLPHGCAANADALSRVNPSDVELKNRIEFQNQRCAGVAVAAPTPAPVATGRPVVVAPMPKSIPVPVTTAAPAESTTTGTAATAATVPPGVPAPAARAAVPTAAPAAPTRRAPPRVATARTEPPARPRTASAARAAAALTVSNDRGWAVQVAAYSVRRTADALAAKLRARGLPSHVDGDHAPYRVRIGHYRTHAAAAAELARLRARKISGFVTQD